MKTDFTSATTLTDTTLHLARCFYIEPVIGSSPIGPFRFTDHDADIVVSGETPSELNGTYASIDSVTPSALDADLDMTVDNMEVVGHIRTGAIEDADVKAGMLDGAIVYVFLVDWTDVAGEGIVALRRADPHQARLRSGRT